MPKRRFQKPTDMSGQQSHEAWLKSVRPVMVYNTAEETIPPFAVMQLVDTEGLGFSNFRADDANNEVVFNVKQCDEGGQLFQNPNMFLFNLGQPIRPRAKGAATFDMPALVLHNGDEDSLPDGLACGPIAGSWYVWSFESAFTCLGHPTQSPVNQSGPGLKLHTVMVGPRGSPNAGYAWSSTGQPGVVTDSIDVNEVVPIGGSVQEKHAINSAAFNVSVTAAGRWTFNLALSARLFAPIDEINRGDTILVNVRRFVHETGEIIATAFYASAAQDIEQDQYGEEIYVSWHTLAVSGSVNLEIDDQVFVTNLSAAPILYRSLSFGMELRGPKHKVAGTPSTAVNPPDNL